MKFLEREEEEEEEALSICAKVVRGARASIYAPAGGLTVTSKSKSGHPAGACDDASAKWTAAAQQTSRANIAASLLTHA
jgi:hypothetical protein